mgnify:CR=1 FL=1
MNIKSKILSVAMAVSLGVLPVMAKQQSQVISIVPTPVSLTEQGGTVTLPKALSVSVSDESLKPAAEYMGTALKGAATLKGVAVGAAKADVSMKLVPDLTKQGAYRFTSDKNGVVIEAGDYQGVINGIATLLQLLPVNAPYNAKAAAVKLTLPCVKINDAPHFGWRGMMLDSSRHWWTVDEVKHFIDLLAFYKLDVFHWHIVDSQGWRIEMKRYPELTAKGAFRTLNNVLDENCDKSAKDGHNPDMRVDRSKMKVVNGDSVYGGFYTQAEVRDVVAYAAQRGITVIPEIDMPGHFFKATEVEPWLTCDGKPNDAVCPGKDSTLEFCKNLYKEIFELFPSKYVYIGGDEVDKTKWRSCPDCAKRMKEEELDNVDALQGWFIREMEVFFRSNGRKLMGWDEIAYDGMSSDAAIMWWRGDNWRVLSAATAMGKKVTCSPTSHVYFDYPQDDNYVDKILKFDPLAMDLKPEQQKLVMGIQANVWTEWIPTMDRIEYMIMPRMLALSETAWCTPETKHTTDKFWDYIQPQFLRLDAMDINYRVPDIQGVGGNNVFVDKMTIAPYTRARNCVLRYTTDGSIPTSKSKLLDKKLTITKDCKLNIASFRPNGKRSEMVTANFVRSGYLQAQDVNPTADGLKVKWFNNKATSCADVDKGGLKRELVCDGIKLPKEVDKDRALIFEGYLYAPIDGIYDISLTSDDGSKMLIDGKEFINNDGLHSINKVQVQIAMKKGYHKIDARYFDYQDNTGALESSFKCVTDPNVKITFKH